MKKFIFLLIFPVMFIVTNTVSGQVKIPVDPKKSAIGQTKWMAYNLKLDKTFQSLVYDINYRYQLKMDSVRLLPAAVSTKVIAYVAVAYKKDEEFKKIFPAGLYEQYQKMIETQKLKVLQLKSAIGN
jgi:hypothetical protein